MIHTLYYMCTVVLCASNNSVYNKVPRPNNIQLVPKVDFNNKETCWNYEANKYYLLVDILKAHAYLPSNLCYKFENTLENMLWK